MSDRTIVLLRLDDLVRADAISEKCHGCIYTCSRTGRSRKYSRAAVIDNAVKLGLLRLAAEPDMMPDVEVKTATSVHGVYKDVHQMAAGCARGASVVGRITASRVLREALAIGLTEFEGML